MTCKRGCCATQIEHYRSVRVSATCTPSRSGNYRQTQDIEDSWNKDIPAYRRLVKGGVQPDTVDGAADLEKHVDAGGVVDAD